MLTVGADAREMRFDVLAGDQNAEIIWDCAVGRVVVEDAVEN